MIFQLKATHLCSDLQSEYSSGVVTPCLLMISWRRAIMRAVHAANLCEKTTLPLQKRNLKPKECNSNNKRGNWLNAQVSKFRLLLFYAFSRQLRVSNYDIYWTNQNARYKSSFIGGYETL